MLKLSLAANGILLGTAIGLFTAFRRYQRRLYLQQGRNLGWPIRAISLAEFDPAFATAEFGPTPAAEVLYIGTGDGVVSGTTDTEAWVLAVLAKRARRMFEFGTCTGKTAYLWARNSPPDARITTLTLAPDQLREYAAAPGDTARAAERAVAASSFDRFLYSGTEAERKVEQLFGDSKAFDETPHLGQCDLIFIDGSHAYSYVESDTRKALRMLAPGGCILWHDYNPYTESTRGVFDFLNRLRAELPLVHLRGTSIIAYRHGRGANRPGNGSPSSTAR